ncbi:hypothetical protein RHD99_00900 [Buttiauxella selenatireducens]|uniref:Uncharacterized protein n=1 Tax=Buttiauxella selenatireducens TaxID=3073902 RepID=A0ABY9SAL8_9ENTR|nr:hypothetical protein [Buttiauxella sp. R73]WMY74575.1 hypothetical protein RHD99_00900 [Buttiauxella sp. R73]
MKRILLICPEFNGYEKIIEKELSRNHYVKLISYKEKDVFNLYGVHRYIYFILTNLAKVTRSSILFRLRYFYALKRSNLIDVVQSKLSKNERYDQTIIIKGFGFRPENIKLIKERFSLDIRLYQWDSHGFYPGIEKLYTECGKVFYFEKESKNNTIYLPNFWVKPIFKPKKTEDKRERVIYVGSFSFQRLFMLIAVRFKLRKHVQTLFSLYTQVRILRRLPFVTDKKISYNQLLSLYNDNKYVLELSNPGQSGLTQRIFDAVNFNDIIIVTTQKHKVLLVDSGISGDVVITIEDVHQGNMDISLLSSKNEIEKFHFYEISHWINTILYS